MKKGKVQSRYKFAGGVGLIILLSVTTGFFSFMLLLLEKRKADLQDIPEAELFLWYGGVVGCYLLFLGLLASQCKYITIDADGITTTHPILPFWSKEYRWQDIDFSVSVDEYSRYDRYEALWLIKDRRIVVRISSYYYRNYSELKKSIPLVHRGKKRLAPVEQFLLITGLKRVEWEHDRAKNK